MAPGPMAKHPSARQRRNSVSTARTIVLRDADADLLPVPVMPPRWLRRCPTCHKTLQEGATCRHKEDGEWVNRLGELVEVDYTDAVKVAWVEMWQYPLVYDAPTVDRHLLNVYVALLQDFYDRQMAGRAVTEVSAELRAFAAEWGIGEKSRRTLQITIEQADEAIAKGRQRRSRTVESTAESADAFTPTFTQEDEDEQYIEEAQVVHEADGRV